MTDALIHGGGSTGRFWDRLVPLLSGPALAVDLPGRGEHPADLATITIDDEVASVVADIEAAGVNDEIVLVAHSSGGLVVPGVAAGLGGQVGRIVHYREGDLTAIVETFATAAFQATANGRALVEDLNAVRQDWQERVKARRDAGA